MSFHYPSPSMSNTYVGLIFILILLVIFKLHCYILFLVFSNVYCIIFQKHVYNVKIFRRQCIELESVDSLSPNDCADHSSLRLKFFLYLSRVVAPSAIGLLN